MPSSVADIVEKLKEKQRSEQLSDEAFAEKLHISRQMWNLVKLGKREPGETVWQGVVRAYPELGGQIIAAYAQELYAPVGKADGDGHDGGKA